MQTIKSRSTESIFTVKCFANSLCFYVEGKSVEYEAFTQFHNEFTKVLHDKSYIPHFVSARIISLNDVHHTSNLPDNERALYILKNISDPLESSEKQNFYTMLEVMKDHGNCDAQKLVEDIKTLIASKDYKTESTGATAASTEGIVVSLGTLVPNSRD